MHQWTQPGRLCNAECRSRRQVHLSVSCRAGFRVHVAASLSRRQAAGDSQLKARPAVCSDEVHSVTMWSTLPQIWVDWQLSSRHGVIRAFKRLANDADMNRQVHEAHVVLGQFQLDSLVPHHRQPCGNRKVRRCIADKAPEQGVQSQQSAAAAQRSPTTACAFPTSRHKEAPATRPLRLAGSRRAASTNEHLAWLRC